MASEVDACGTLTLKGTPLAELRVTDLKWELENRGLSKSGSKTQLIERLKAQLLLEKLQQEAAQSSGDEQHEGKVPNIALQQDDKAGQSEFVRQYLQQQQRNLEIQMEVKKQFEEERKRKSADESSADDESRPTNVAADNPELTSAKKFTDDASNAPAKEVAKMPRPVRKSIRNSLKGESGLVVEQVKNRPESPKLEHQRQRAQSGSSLSSRSPSPDQSSQSRRGRPTRTVVRKVERSRSASSSSSSEEESPKKKQRHKNNSSSRSGSRSPKAISPKMHTQRSRRQSNADQVTEKDLPHDGGGDKSAGKNENADKIVATSSRKKWRKKQPLAQGIAESANTNQKKESVTAATSALNIADDTKEKPTEHEQDVREVVASAVSSTTASGVAAVKSDAPAGRTVEATREKVELEKDKLISQEKTNQKHNELASNQKGEQDERIVEKSSASLKKDAKGPQNSSRRQRSRSSSSGSSSVGSRSRSPVGKKRSGSSSVSSSDTESQSSGSSSDSSMDDSPKQASKASGEAQTPSRQLSRTQERPDAAEEMQVESTRNKSPMGRYTGHNERDKESSVQPSAPGEPKSKGQEEKQNQLDKEQENRSREAKEKPCCPDDDSKVAESLEKSKEHVNNTDADEETAPKKGIKRRKWNSKASKAAKPTKRTTSIEISSDVLKNLIGDVKLTETVFEMETEVVNTLDYDDQEEDQRDVKVKRVQSPNKEEKLEEEDDRRVETRDASPESVEIPSEPEKKIIKLSNAAPKVAAKKVKEGKKSKDEKKGDAAGKKEKKHVALVDKEAKEKVVATNRISKPLLPVVDEPEPVTGRQSPARYPPDRVIRITSLVRPFTVNQLKELLRRSGELDDEYFWINDIKSHCLAAYKTQEQASAARTALHGTRWPQSNPKILFVDFASIDDVLHRKQEGDVPLPAVPGKRPQDDQKKIKESKNVEKEEKKHKAKEPKERIRVEREKEERDTRDRKREVEKKNVVREWDRDKIQQLSRSRSKSKERDRLARRSRSWDREQRKRGEYGKEKRTEDRRKEKKQKDAKTEEEPPAKLLDDLFRKTKATPCIYWLPLTEEQAQLRLVKRLEEEKERQKRIAAAEEREKEELRKRETARLERHRERDKAREKSRDRSRPERRSSRSSSKSRSRRRR